MGILRDIFGPSHREIWAGVAKTIGGTFHDGGLFGRSEVKYPFGPWEMVLDTYTSGAGQHSTTHTRLTVLFSSRDFLRCKIYRENAVATVGKWFGMQDIEVGSLSFDRDFVIRGDDIEQIRRLLSSSEIRDLISAQPGIGLEIKGHDDGGLLGRAFPRNISMLRFSRVGVIKDKNTLSGLFFLFSKLLDRLVEIGSASEDNPSMYPPKPTIR